MRKSLVMFISTLVLVSGIPQPAAAQINFLLGLGTGLVLGSGGQTQTHLGTPAGEIVYLMPRAGERVKDALGLSFIVYGCTSHPWGSASSRRFWTVRECLTTVTQNLPKDRELVRAVMIHSPAHIGEVYVQFILTAKENLRPESELPPITITK